MSSAARIEELQKKFDENPRRYFAPLANECRKAGDLDAAIAICRTHLPQQPGHMSGHIVYGQALFESGEMDEARTVFETALGLDPENLIALRHMGDIAAHHGDMAGARQWYTRVLETDPRNEEIQSLVAGLDQAPATTGSEVASATGSEDAAAAVNDDPFAARIEEAPAAMGLDQSFADADDAPRVRGGLPTLVDPALLAAAADAIPDSEAVDPGYADSVSFEAGPLVTTEAEASTGASAPREELLEPTALEFEVPADAGTLDGLETTTFQAPSADEYSSYERVGDEALLDGIEAQASQVEGLESADFDASGYGGSGLEAIAAPSFEFEPADAGPLQDPVPEPPAGEAFVTETMAELYLRQGYRDDALAVYRKLVRQSPGDDALRARMERLEAELAADATYRQATEAYAGEAERDDVIAGLPRAIDPALVAAAAEAGEENVASPVRAAGTGPTIREYLFALATGTIAPPDETVEDAGAAWPADDEVALAVEPAPADDWSTAAAAEAPPASEVAEVVDLGAFDLAEPEDGPPTASPTTSPTASPAASSAALPTSSTEAREGGLDALFGAPSEADRRAADALAAAYATDTPHTTDSARTTDTAATGMPVAPEMAAAGDEPTHPGLSAIEPDEVSSGEPEADPLRGRPARPAGNDLSLDSVFGTPRQQGAPRNTGSFSFDQFFSEGAARPAREEAPEQPASGGDEEDLEQFNSWLHNLRNQ